MKTQFKLVGLSRPKQMTCEPLDRVDHFWPKVGISQDRFNALWEYRKDNWEEEMTCTIEYNSISEDGIPINGMVIEVQHK